MIQFILACQDDETGGFADRPGDVVGVLFLCHVPAHFLRLLPLLLPYIPVSFSLRIAYINCLSIWLIQIISSKVKCTIPVFKFGGTMTSQFFAVALFPQVDPFHTLFGLAGLSLLGERSVKSVNPVLCMPEDKVRGTGIVLQYL